jgi:hypothetical protein
MYGFGRIDWIVCKVILRARSRENFWTIITEIENFPWGLGSEKHGVPRAQVILTDNRLIRGSVPVLSLRAHQRTQKLDEKTVNSCDQVQAPKIAPSLVDIHICRPTFTMLALRLLDLEESAIVCTLRLAHQTWKYNWFHFSGTLGDAFPEVAQMMSRNIITNNNQTTALAWLQNRDGISTSVDFHVTWVLLILQAKWLMELPHRAVWNDDSSHRPFNNSKSKAGSYGTISDSHMS